jgi:hypothetical protein
MNVNIRDTTTNEDFYKDERMHDACHYNSNYHLYYSTMGPYSLNAKFMTHELKH